jgi:DNA-directed RNA polymerase specialized sigma24 family protein
VAVERMSDDGREKSPKSWLEPEFRRRLLRWIKRHVRDPATAEDLTQDVLLGIVGRDFADCRDVERFAQRVARNLVASEWRRVVRKPDASDSLDGLPARETLDWTDILREHLRALRPQITRDLGPVQRRLLDAYLDEELTTVPALSERLHTHPSNVWRMLRGIARWIIVRG